MKLNPFFILKFRNFRLLYTGQFISRIGSEMQTVAAIWHVYLLTHSPYSLGLIGLAQFLPYMFLSPFTGTVADSVNKRKLLIVNQLIMFSLATLLAIVTFLHLATPLIIYILVGLISATYAFDAPARQALVPRIIPREHLQQAYGFSGIVWRSAGFIGPAIGGFVIAAWGVQWAYLFNGLSFLAIMIAAIKLNVDKEILGSTVKVSKSAIKEGFLFIKNTPILLSMSILDFFGSFFGTAEVLMPIFAKDIFHVGAQGLGIMYSADGIGALLAGVVFTSFKTIKNKGKLVVISVALYGVCVIAFGLTKNFYLALVFLACSGVFDMINTTIRVTIRQMVTPDHLRGRVTSFSNTLATGGPKLGEIEAGITAGWFGAPLSVVIGGIGTLLTTGIVMLFVPKLAKYKDEAK